MIKSILFIVASTLVLTACSNFNLCYYSDEFDVNGESYVINLYAFENNCYYDRFQKYSENTNQTIKNCLSQRSISEIKEDFDYSTLIKGKPGTTLNNIKCVQIDRYDMDETKKLIEIIDEKLKGMFESYVTSIYNACIDLCQNACKNNSSSDVVGWTKAKLRNDDNFIGIRISKDVYITVSVTGSLYLNSASKSSVVYSKSGEEEINSKFIAKDGDEIDLNIEINSKRKFQSKTDLLGRTYLDFLPINTSLVLDNLTNKYLLQGPNYKAVECGYYIKESRKNSATCRFYHSNISEINTALQNIKITQDKIDSINNYYNSKYKTAIFSDGDFYKYSNDVMNGIIGLNSNNGSIILDKEFEDENILNIKPNPSNNQNKIINAFGFDDDDGYIWLNSGTSHPIKISKPSKIAIKILYEGSENISCTYTIKEETIKNDKTFQLFDGKEPIMKISPIKVENGKQLWHILKYQDDTNQKQRDIIFNKFSTILNKDKFISKVNIEAIEGGVNCYSKVLIKIIPLKEIEIEETGYLAFYIPSIAESIPSNYKIYHMVLNPKVIESKYINQINSKLNKDELISRFFEGEQDMSDSVTLLKTSDLEKLDNNQIEDSDRNKYIFVRSGQVLRLDYTNWFEIDNKEKIEIRTIEKEDLKDLKTNTENNGAETIQAPKTLDYGIGLNYFILRRKPYFCYGNANENVEKEFMCKYKNGIYSNIQKGVETLKEGKVEKVDISEDNVCYIELEACMAEADLVSEFLKIDITKANCKFNSEIGKEGIKKNLVEFWDQVYSAYKSYENPNKNVKCDDPYSKTIGRVYDEAIKCAQALSDKDYQIFRGKNNSEGVSYKKQIDSEDFKEIINSKSQTNISIKEKIEKMKKFFGTEELEIINTYNEEKGEKTEKVDSKTIVYKSSLYYYLSNYCGDGNQQNNSCKLNAPQCYDFSNYIGKLEKLFDGLKSVNTASNNINDFGNLDELSIMFGAQKLENFSKKNNSGLIKNFVALQSDSLEDKNNLLVSYGKTISLEGTNFLRFFIIQDSSSADEFKRNSLRGINWNNTENKEISNWIYRTAFEASSKHRNGARLAMFIGDDAKDYRDNSVLNDKATNNVLHLVKYNEENGYYSLDKNTKFRFNDNGVLEKSSNGSIGVNFADETNFPEGNKYLESLDNGGKANLFFKIIDTDNNLNNNSGSYQIKIKTVNNNESTIISYFKSFFNMVLSFVDGSYIDIEERNGVKIQCDVKNNLQGKCYIYNDSFTDNNGANCSEGDADCYRSCKGIEYNNNTSKCKQYYDGKGFVKNVYKTFVNNPLYQFIAKLALVLAITMYGFGYFFGLSGFTQSEIITRIIRFCFIYFMISPSGWDFFNNYIVKFFKDGIDSILFLIASAFEINLDSELSIAVASGNYSDKSVIFSTCFSNLELIFSAPVFNKMLGLAFSSWFGLVYLYLVFTTVINYIVGVFSAMIMYLTSQIYMSLVFCFFPLVVLFMFFEKTKKTFDNWINLLIGFAGQQIFLVMTISFFNILIYNFIKSTFSYTVCWLGIFNMNVAGIPLAAISFWKIPSSSATSGSLNTVDENMPSFYSIMSFYIIGILMGKFVTGAAELGQNIFGGGVNIAGGMAGKAMNGLNNGAEKLKIGMKAVGTGFYKNTANRLGGKAIKDYGEKQSKERIARKTKRQELTTEINKKTEDSMEKYKNSAEFHNDIKNMRKSNPKMSETQARNQILEGKQKEFNRQATIASVAKLYSEDIQKMMNKNDKNSHTDFESLDDQRKNEQAEKFAKLRGFLEK